MSDETLGISSFTTAEELKVALDRWYLPTTYIYGPDGEQITGFAVREHTLTDGSKVRDLHLIAEAEHAKNTR